MNTKSLPPRHVMMQAFLSADGEYEGVFYTGVHTTGIFCRPSCPAKKPKPKNVEFFATSREALFAGFRPCKRCRPLEPAGTPPAWLRRLLEEVEAEPERRWTDADLRRRGINPDRVRRWFQRYHGLTFHAYTRARRLGLALGQIRQGDLVIDAAYDQGYESLSGFNEAFRRLLGSSPRAVRNAPVVVLDRLPTALGPMVACATDEALCLLEFADRRMLETQLRRLRQRLGCRIIPGRNSLLADVAAELEEYFAGRRSEFTIPLLTLGSHFQKKVWEKIRQIPYAETTTYGALARLTGGPTAVRAVGRATGDNPIAILIPCHRVVGSDGRLTGYGGGLWRKQRLLELEAGQASILEETGQSTPDSPRELLSRRASASSGASPRSISPCPSSEKLSLLSAARQPVSGFLWLQTSRSGPTALPGATDGPIEPRNVLEPRQLLRERESRPRE